ncbi:tetratricopeptide repeat protein 23 [Thalassophryne amazonica]|uniref:tetratricopeptide repeat protein 23 n=1 Tax=Thalassophryne amazonica TaxID=390379 RepID=UPI001471965D|nr:tetratricopeptide repeat protein 23 [Thalassophryne amazonica]
MEDAEEMAKSRPKSNDFKSSIRSVDSTIGAIAASSECDADVMSSLTGCAKVEFIMVPPEEKLIYFEKRAETLAGKQEFDACIQDLVRCVALTKVFYGEGCLKVAQAYATLAKAYFKYKGWGLQAWEHSSQARDLLPLCSSISCRREKLEVLMCLLSTHLTQGGAALLSHTLEEAESSYLEASQILKELHRQDGVNPDEKIETQLEISTGLTRVYRRQNRLEEALHQCEKSLNLLRDSGKSEKMYSVYRDMAAIEQNKGQLERSIENLSKAHAIALSHSLGDLEVAEISHNLALVLSAAPEPHHNESAGQYFEQSLSGYKNCVGPHNATFLATQDDFCRFLLTNGQKERCAEIQRASLTFKRSTFGDFSAEVADTLQLIGSVEMTQGQMKQAYRNMTKCLEIQRLMDGHHHKRTKATQKAVDVLARTPEVSERRRRQNKGKTKPHVFSDVPSSGIERNSNSEP